MQVVRAAAGVVGDGRDAGVGRQVPGVAVARHVPGPRDELRGQQCSHPRHGLDDLGGLVFGEHLRDLRVELLDALVQIQNLLGEVRDELGGAGLPEQDGALGVAGLDGPLGDVCRVARYTYTTSWPWLTSSASSSADRRLEMSTAQRASVAGSQAAATRARVASSSLATLRERSRRPS